MGFVNVWSVTALVTEFKCPKSDKFLGFTCTDVISFFVSQVSELYRFHSLPLGFKYRIGFSFHGFIRQ